MTTVLNCPECEAKGLTWATQHETAVVARRALSLHRFKEHGIRSEKAIAEAARKERAAARVVGRLTPEMVAALGPEPGPGDPKRSAWKKKRWRMLNPDRVALWRRRARARRRAQPHLSPAEVEQRNNLQRSAWWQVEGTKQVPINLSECPCCGARFMALKPQS